MDQEKETKQGNPYNYFRPVLPKKLLVSVSAYRAMMKEKHKVEIEQNAAVEALLNIGLEASGIAV